MPRALLQYWKPERIAENSAQVLDHIASEQLGGVDKGDVLFLVTVRRGDLRLVGRIEVGALANIKEARRLLGRQDLWEARYHVIATPGTAQHLQDIGLLPVASDLRFDSKHQDRLQLVNGGVNAQQLQRIRVLTPESAQALDVIWGAGGSLPLDEGGSGPTLRRTVVIQQLLRNSAIARWVKQRHDFVCQVCGLPLMTRFGPYAESAHIQPLGAPHDGPDVKGNILCLCPNDHVLFDLGAFSVGDDLRLIGRDGKLRTTEDHRPHPKYLLHHRKQFGYM